MTELKIGERIAFLRRQKGITQEELAKALGVSNQAVSKWESAQCCPDIQLLPELAKFFDVSVGSLLGYEAPVASEDLLLKLRSRIEALQKGEDFQEVFRLAAALHVIIFAKCMTAGPGSSNPGFDTEDAVEHAGNAEWGYSCCNIPQITTVMRGGSVFFSNNQDQRLARLTDAQLGRIASVLKPFCDRSNLKVAAVLYNLTVHSEDAYAAPSAIAEKCGLTQEAVSSCLSEGLWPYLLEKETGTEKLYRFEGMYMNLIPMLAMFDMR